MRRGETHMRRHALLAPTEDLRGALCLGDRRFTEDGLSRPEVAMLLTFCQHCPLREACATDRDRWREANPDDWRAFTGVWGGAAFTRGGPYKGAGRQESQTRTRPTGRPTSSA